MKVFLKSALSATAVPIGFTIANRLWDGSWPTVEFVITVFFAALASKPFTRDGAKEDAEYYGVGKESA